MSHPIVDMLKAYFKNETPEIDSTLEAELISKAKEQALLPFLYYVYHKKEYRSYYITSSIAQEEFLKLQTELTGFFNEANIKHLFLKGSILYQLYPDPALRTRGDIDIVVENKRFNEARQILLDHGYQMLSIESQHHIEFIKNKSIVELHFLLFDDFRSTSYFKDPFELAYPIDKCLYTFTNENFFVYCLYHFAIHLRMGAGLRYILDFYYMLKKWDMDKDLLHRKIEEIGYTRLYHNILNAIYFLTEEELDEFPKEDINFFIEYLVKSGIHGFGEESQREEKGFGIKNNKLKAIIAGTFMLNKPFRISKYPRLGKHWFTYPLCLIHRIIYLLCTQTKRLFKLLFSKKNKVTKEEKDFFNKLGV
ncbi:MAG: nucleotidyltransferase family protein [Anaeroplasmataceae bacterium]|nr:nucleotidyltransferase family protein [Anaeroplasmataceae bacterium]MDE6415370.1 nucleotidyltransferase family protein [Anaeroplasmataceae bacterium]